jgi:hypothetical protein
MKVRVEKDGKWEELEVSQVIVYSDKGNPIAGVGEVEGGSYISTMAGDEEFEEVMALLGEDFQGRVKKVEIKLGR